MRRQFLSSVAIKSVDTDAVRRAADQYAARMLVTHAEVEEIVVFGSFTTGTYVPGSDLDLFVILSRSEKTVWDRVPEYLPGAFPVGVDVFPYTRAELGRMPPSSLLEAVAASQWRYRRE